MRQRSLSTATVLMAASALAACVSPRYAIDQPGARTARAPSAPVTAGRRMVGQPYQVGGIWYVPHEQPDYDEVGVASWYGEQFHLKATANGETFDMNAVTAAHTTLPLPSIVEVTNLDNGKKLRVRVNDRGPFVGDRIIDLSREAARELGYERQGVTKVRVRYVGPAPLLGPEAGVRVAKAEPLRAPMPIALPPRSFGPTPARAEDVLELAAGSPAKAAVVERAPLPTPRPAASAPIQVAELPPTRAAAPTPALPLPPAMPEPLRPAVSAASTLRIQAGAFSTPENAQKAVAQLASAGAATIVPVQRDGGMLYRVVMPAPADEVEAYALRDRVAEIGFSDARVITAF